MSKYSDLNQRGQLQTFEKQSESLDQKNPVVILFHGYGADAHDLVGLSDFVPNSESFHWIFPQGPLEVPIGPGWTGRAWWTIDVSKFTENRDISEEVPSGIESLRKKVITMINTLKIPWGQIYLGGFSQGGMLALDIAMHAPEKPQGMIFLSTALINKNYFSSLGEKLEGVPFFLSHGTADPVINIKNAQRLESFLKAQKASGALIPFSGGHEIPMPIIQKMGQFLNLK